MFRSAFSNHDTIWPRAAAGTQRIMFYTLGAQDTDSSSDESQISVAWDATKEIESLPEYGTDEHTQTVTRHVDNLVQCYVSVLRTTQVGCLII